MFRHYFNPLRRSRAIFSIALFLAVMFCVFTPRGVSSSVNGLMLRSFPKSREKTYHPWHQPEVKSNLVYTLLGKSVTYQEYIWTSVSQARLLNPTVPIYVILEDAALKDSEQEVEARADKYNVILSSYDSLANSSRTLAAFREVFFVVKNMRPVDGNPLFVKNTMERLLAVHALAEHHNLQNVYHIENDNMMYIDLDRHLDVMKACEIGVGIPIIDRNQAAVSFSYFRDEPSLRLLSEFIINFYRKGREAMVTELNTTYVNDMTVVYNFLAKTPKTPEGLRVEIMPTWIIKDGEQNCFWSHDKSIYDGAAMGQFFGGTHSNPAAHWFEAQRPFKELKDKKLFWKQCEFSHTRVFSQKLLCPWIDDFRVINLHIHSKQLDRFSSANPFVNL